MATTRQRKAVERIVENGGIVSTAMLDVGYTPATAKTPQKLTESKGYKEVLKEYGLTERLIVKSLVDDIKSKPEKRLGELTLGADILGMKVVKEAQNRTLVLMVSGETANRYVEGRLNKATE